MDKNTAGEEEYKWDVLQTLYTEEYNLGFPCSRVEVLFDFDNSLLLFRPIRRVGDSPINDLPTEERVKMPKQHAARKCEVQRVLRILKDEVHIACSRRGLTHDYDLYPYTKEHDVRRTRWSKGVI